MWFFSNLSFLECFSRWVVASRRSRQGGYVALKEGVVHCMNPVAPAREHFPVKPLIMALPCLLSVQQQAGRVWCPVLYEYTCGPSSLNYPDVFANICSLTVCDILGTAAGAQHPCSDRGLGPNWTEAPNSLKSWVPSWGIRESWSVPGICATGLCAGELCKTAFCFQQVCTCSSWPQQREPLGVAWFLSVRGTICFCCLTWVKKKILQSGNDI